MTTPRSLPMPHNPLAGDSDSAWPVLARIPDLSDSDRSMPQRPSRAAATPRPASHRVDAPLARPAATTVHRLDDDCDDDRSLFDKHSAHKRQPPAHHLRQRSARQAAGVDRKPGQSRVLPKWDPFTISGKRLPESVGPIINFLVLVVLFTTAGTAILSLRGANRAGTSETPPTAVHTEHTAAAPAAPPVPTAVGPLGAAASRLVPTTTADPPVISLPASTPPKLTPPAVKGDVTNGNVTGIDSKPVIEPTKQDFPTIDLPEPEFPATGDKSLPQAQTSDHRLPIARFSGQILEVETRQAKNDDQSSIH